MSPCFPWGDIFAEHFGGVNFAEQQHREFIDVDNDTEIGYLEVLKKQRMRSNLDFLEVGRREAGRINLSSATGIPMAFIIPLVHKADISRLAYVRVKTVRHLCGGGYDSLDKIASADLAEMETKMDAYYKTLGKSLADFRAVIPLAWMIGGGENPTKGSERLLK